MGIITYMPLIIVLCVSLFCAAETPQVDCDPVDLNCKSETYEIVKLKKDNFLVLRDEIGGSSTSKFLDELVRFKSGETVYIYITSGGGSVTSGMEIASAINTLSKSGVDVRCIASTAMSMAFVILQYCPVRYVTESSILMQHQMSLGTRGQIKNIFTFLDFLNRLDKEITDVQSARMKTTSTEFDKLTAHDLWLTGKNAVEMNAADKIVGVVCDFTPTMTEKMVETWFGDLTLKYSSCPLMTYPLEIVSKNTDKNINTYKLNSRYDITTYVSNKVYGIENSYDGYYI